MSRIGKMPITVPAGVTVTVDDNNMVTVKGAKGELKQQLCPIHLSQSGTKYKSKRGTNHGKAIRLRASNDLSAVAVLS